MYQRHLHFSALCVLVFFYLDVHNNFVKHGYYDVLVLSRGRRRYDDRVIIGIKLRFMLKHHQALNAQPMTMSQNLEALTVS